MQRLSISQRVVDRMTWSVVRIENSLEFNKCELWGTYEVEARYSTQQHQGITVDTKSVLVTHTNWLGWGL